MVPQGTDDGFPTAEGLHEATTGPSEVLVAGSKAAVEFGWGEDHKLTGRRRKVEASKKAKPGSFGALMTPQTMKSTAILFPL